MRIEFKAPAKNKLILFDAHRSSVISAYLKNIDYTKLYVRYETINLFILFKTIFNYNFDLKFMQNYIINFIKAVRPKVVISFTDNNKFFYNLKTYFLK